MESTSTTIIIFGATGDLVAKKIVPSLYSLYKSKRLPEKFKVIGFARRDFNGEKYYPILKESLEKYGKVDLTKEDVSEFLKLFEYHQGNFDDLESYKGLASKLRSIDKVWDDCSDKLFYLAVPPESYEGLFHNLALSGVTITCVKPGGWSRIIVEKPFGDDLKSATELDNTIKTLFKEEQIYRIDHYLGKPMLREIIPFRQKFDKYQWNKDDIESINIIAWEDLGVENRGAFYDPLGALRDFGQNHLLEIVALLTMDPNAEADDMFRNNRATILKKLKQYSDDEVKQNTYRAQYDGYKNINEVKPDSSTETYFRVKVVLEDENWKEVALTIESGKRLGSTRKEIIINFKNKDKLIFEFDKHNKIYLESKGNSEDLFQLNNNQSQYVSEYATLIEEGMNQKKKYFIGIEEIFACWQFIDPIENAWKKGLVPLNYYEPDTNDFTKEVRSWKSEVRSSN